MSKKSTKHSGLKRWGKRLLWAVLCVVVLGLVARLSLKTGYIQNWVKATIVSTANEQLNGTLSIDQLSGDLWNEVFVSGIQLHQKNETLAAVDSARANYNIWALLDGEIDISEVHVYQPTMNLHQHNGEWNVQQVMAESSDTTPSETSWPFQIGSFQLHDGAISVSSDSLLMNDSLSVDKLTIASSFAYSGNSYRLNLRGLSFELRQSALGEPLRVETAATADNNRLTLEKLVLATGQSMVQSSAFFSPGDSTGQVDLTASPLAWQDIVGVAKEMPLRSDLQLDIGVAGTLQQFEVTVDMQAQGMEQFQLQSQLAWNQELTLNQLSADITQFNPSIFLADTTLPTVEQLETNFSGRVPLSNYQNGYGDFQFSAFKIAKNPYEIDRFVTSGKLQRSSAMLDIEIQQGQQQVTANVNADQLWADWPSVQATVQGSNIDPGYWAQDSTYAGNLSFESSMSGQGWYPDTKPWSYSLQLNDGRMMGQPISELSIDGKISASDASVDGQLKIHDGMLDLMANVRNLTDIPSYDYNLESRDFDVAALMEMPDFETALNTTISGSGRGSNIADLQLSSSVSVDSSMINGELIRNLTADISLRDTVAVVDSARLQSTIAEGSLWGRLNILRHYDSQNELSLDLQLKDLQALAPLADVEQLAAEGQIKGRLRPVENENLDFTGTFDFDDVIYGNVFAADRTEGSLNTRFRQSDLKYNVDIDFGAPTFSGVNIQDLRLQTQGAYGNPRLSGSYDLRFSSPNEGRIEQSGEYNASEDSIRVRTSEYNIISDYRILSLESPFDLTIYGDTLRMDTMRVSSGDGAFLEMAVPVLNEYEQRAFIHGNSLNTAVIQSCLLGQTYVKGMLSGRMDFARKDTVLNADGQLLLSDVQYKETSFDTLLVEGNIADQRLQGTLSVRHDQQQLIDGEASLPFRLGDPQTLPPAFFEEPVSGTMQVHKISIDRFKSIFAEAGITNTTGVFSFLGSLEGKAGNPQFSADATLSKARLSGVAVDSVTAGFDYIHDDAELRLNSSVMSLRQKAADIQARVPFFINMKTFRVDLPEEKDSISVDVTTNDFNLAALNDFLDPRQVRNVSGRVNGGVQVSGQLGDLKTDGQLKFRNGAFRLMPAGIRVKDIKSTFTFDPNQVKLTEFSANSGKGSMSASGIVEVTEMMPDNIDINVTAKNFRIANTTNYNAVINMDTHAGGSVTQPRITGSLSFVSGFLQLQNFGEKSVETIQLDSVQTQAPDISVYDSLALDMDVSFNRRFYIRNQRYLEMEIELDGTLDLVKDKGKELQLFGTMSAPGGYARPFGKEFDLQEGNVTFSGDPTNPQLMIRTRYEPPQTQEDIVIWYIIEGTVENPQFKYESQPTMELENIVSYTIFGQPYYALDSWKQVVAGSGNTSAANVALDVLLDRVEALATQKLGIDVVKIDNTQSGGESGTQITTGWYLNPKVFLAIQNVITGSTPDTSFLLEYMLRKDLKLIIRQGNGIRQGVDLKWNYDY